MVGIYCRVSGEEQKKEETIQTQRRETSNYCQLHDLPVYDFYLDDGVTGTLPFDQRPEGKRLLADAQAGRFAEIVVYKTARLGRDFYETVSILRLLREQGLLVRSVTEHYDASTPDGRFMQGIHAVFAEKAREDIVEQSIAGCNRVAALGTWMGGNRPFGYQTVGQDATRALVVDDQEAQWVRQIFHWLVVDRMTCTGIAKRLNALGVKTPFAVDGRLFRGAPSSGEWITTRVRTLIANPIYKGAHTYGRKSKVRQPVVQAVPAIIESDLWDAAQQRLRENLELSPRNRKRQYLLSGKMRCGTCGGKYVGIQSHGCGKQNYICRARNQRGLAGCSSPNIPAVIAETVIWRELEAYLRDPGKIVETLTGRRNQAETEIDTLRLQIATLVQQQEGKKRERQRLIDLYTVDAISRDDYLIKYQRLQQDETNLVEEEETLRAALLSLEHSQQEIRAADDYIRTIRQGLDADPSWDKKREWVRLLVTEIVVTAEEGKPVLDWSFLFSPPKSAFTKCARLRSFSNWGWMAVPARVWLGRFAA